MKTKRSEWDVAEVKAFNNREEAKGILRDAKGYLDHAILSLEEKDTKATHHCMARVRECLSEANLRLRG